MVFGLRRWLWAHGLPALFALLLGVSVLSPSVGQAAQPAAYSPRAHVVGDDRGGLITDRLQQMRQLLNHAQPVEIRGDVCFSTCMMLLGLPDVCVSPQTAFGFHGPSRFGRELDPAVFEKASQVIAGFYPTQLRQWYLAEARFQIDSLSKRSGADMIAMGIRPCAPLRVSLVQ